MSAVVKAEPGPLEIIDRIVSAGTDRLTPEHMEVIERLFALSERAKKDQRKQEFDDAIARIQAKLPQIEKDGRITGGSNAAYARYETIDEYIRPLLAEEGVSIRVSEDDGTDESGKTLFSITVSKGGHSETIKRRFSADKGATNRDGKPIRSAIQDDGSTSTYAKRYLLIAFFNIVTRNQDTDGHGPMPKITEDQARDLEILLTDNNRNVAQFLEYKRLKTLGDMLARDYKQAVQDIQQVAANAKRVQK